MRTAQRSYIGEGRVYIGPYNGSAPMREVGQLKEFKLNLTEVIKEMTNLQGGGGLADQTSRISKVEASFDFLSLSSENLALAIRGVGSDLKTTAVTTEAHIAYQGGLLPVLGIAPTSVILTVTAEGWVTATAYQLGDIVKPTSGTHYYQCTTAGTSGDTEPTWKTDGTNTADGSTLVWADMGVRTIPASEYDVGSAGVYIHTDTMMIPADGIAVNLAYTPSAGTLIQAMTTPSLEWRVLFWGQTLPEAMPPWLSICTASSSPHRRILASSVRISQTWR